jgi:tryptophan-rich sensory protein
MTKYWMRVGLFLVWVVMLQLSGYLMGILTEANLEPWYRLLHKSSLTPPGVVFAIVWPILYVLLAIVGWCVFLKETGVSKSIQMLYVMQLFFNLTWTPLFFGLHWIGMAVSVLILTVLLTFCLMVRLYQAEQKRLMFLLMPYWFWISFASYLNIVTFLIN